MRAVKSAAGNSGMPILHPSGFVEGADPRALDDPKLRNVLFAPLDLYPASGSVIRLPFLSGGPPSERYLETIVETRLQQGLSCFWDSPRD